MTLALVDPVARFLLWLFRLNSRTAVDFSSDLNDNSSRWFSLGGVAPGVWPAIPGARVNVAEGAGHRRARNMVSGRPSPLRRWLVAGRVAGSTGFLVVAALLIQSYAGLSAIDPPAGRAISS